MNAIEIVNLTKCYGTKKAVNGLSLEIGEGELFALLGVNGAGKTTTIKMLSCLTSPTDGNAKLLGESIKGNTEKIKEFIAVSPQETAIAPNLTVYENLEMLARIHGFDKATAKKKTEEMIEKLSLGEYSKIKSKTLSGGWQRRLSIALALISEPKILFLDEPTLGLDVLARHELWNVVGQLKGKITIILTTHYLEEAEALSDRIGIMKDGQLKALGTAPELIKLGGAATFEDAFVNIVTGGKIK